MTFVSWLLAVVGPVAGFGSVDVGALVLAGAITVLASVVLLRWVSTAAGSRAEVGRRTVAMRARSHGLAVPVQQDPDAPGHPRPRAPGRGPAVAPGIVAA